MTDPEPVPTKADCYSAGERSAMEWSQDFRAQFLGPLLRLLAACRFTPDHLTLASLVCGLSFCGLWFVAKPWSFAAIVLHVLLDGLDGPLARHLGVASRRGSFTDTTADQVVVVATTMALMTDGVLHIAAGTLYAVVYTVVVYFAMVRNALEVPYSWLLRPRFIVYAWMLVETYAWPGSLNYVVWLFTGLLGLKLATGFFRIRDQI